MRIYGGDSGLLGRGLWMGRRKSSIAVGPTITAPGSIDVSTFKIGTTQTITAGTATATGGGTVTYEFRHLANGVTVSTLAAYAHVGANDGQGGAAQWRAVETGGTNPGATAWQTVASGTITYPAPVAAGSLVNQSFTDDTGVQTYDASGDFTGSALVFSLVSPPSGVTINSGTGVVSFDTDALTLQTGTSITVRATNSGGFADSAFLLDIVTGQQITLSGVSFNGTDTISMTVNRAGTIYWMITDNATETATDVINATGAIDSGNFVVSSGSNNATISYPNTPVGNHYLHIVADAATSPAPSAVDSTQYTFPSGDTTAPILTSPTDAANGQTASTGSVTTDEANGTLYWVVTTSSTAPSAAQVKNGLDATGSPSDGDANSQAVTVAGVQNITPSGLTASTSYTTHFMHEDAAGNQSSVVSASGFTTSAAATVPAAMVDANWSVATGSGASEVDMTIASAPADGGSAITKYQYTTDSGATWRDTGLTATGSVTLTLQSDGSAMAASTSYDFQVRAVNGVGNAPASNTESATSGASGGSIPTFGAAGSGADSMNGITPGMPTHSAGTLLVLLLTNRGNDLNWTPTDGWIELYTGTSGGTGSSGRRGQIFYKFAASGAETAPSIPDLGNHLAGQIFAFEGASAISVLGTPTASSGSAVSISSGTTGGANRRIAVVCFSNGDTTVDQITSWTNANLTNVTDHGGHRTDQGAGGGFDVGSGELATAGDAGTFTATMAAVTSNYLGVVMEIL